MASEYITISTDVEGQLLLVQRKPKTLEEKTQKFNIIAQSLSPAVIRRASVDDLRGLCTGLIDVTRVEDGKHKRIKSSELAEALIEATAAKRQEKEAADAALAGMVAQVLGENAKLSVLEEDIITHAELIKLEPEKALDRLMQGWANEGIKEVTIAKSYGKRVNAFFDIKALTIMTPEQAKAFKEVWRKRLLPIHTAINQSLDDSRETDGLERREIQGKPVIDWAVNVLNKLTTGEFNWKQVAYAMAIVTGRRMSEVLGEKTKFVADGNTHVYFYGQNKKKDDVESLWYRLPVLCDSSLVIKGWQYLVNEDKCIPASLVNSRYGKQLSMDMPKSTRETLKNLGLLIFKDTRDFYAGTMVMWHKRHELNGGKQIPPETNFIGGILGHDNDFMATANYQKMRVLWSDGELVDPLDSDDFSKFARRLDEKGTELSKSNKRGQGL